MQRLQGLLKTFTRKPEMSADYLEFMGKVIEKGHASQIPRDEAPPPPGRSWYLPHFATYHNTKHTIRVVFDSSCEFQGQSAFTWPRPDEQSHRRPNALPQGKHRRNVRRGADVSLLLRRRST